jgi:hypothetical protein
MDLTPRLGDTDNNLLFKIAAALDSGAVNGITQAAADARYVFKSGDTMTGALTLPASLSLIFGAASAVHPALKDSGAGFSELSVMKGDGSAFASLLAGFMWARIEDTGTGTSPSAFEVYHDTTSGTPAINCGVSYDMRADSDTTGRQLQCRFTSLWSDATHATRTSQLRVLPTKNGTTTECLRLTVDAVDLRNGAALQIAGSSYFNTQQIYAGGTVYTLTAVSAGVDFGTTDPIITLNAAGTYAIRAKVKVALNGATFAANRTLTIKLRRTNNTPADVANSSTTWTVPVVTTITNTLAVIELPEVFYTTAVATDTIQIFADISVLPTAGTISVDEASIVAVRLS